MRISDWSSDVCSSDLIETSGDSALTAAEQWLQLAPLERERTAIYASGRALRTAVNEAVQRGLKANGELGKTSLDLTVLSRVNATREELRYVSAYRPGMVLDVRSPDKHQRLPRGEYKVDRIDEKTREVFLVDRSEEHTSELQSLMRTSSAVFFLKKK